MAKLDWKTSSSSSHQCLTLLKLSWITNPHRHIPTSSGKPSLTSTVHLDWDFETVMVKCPKERERERNKANHSCCCCYLFQRNKKCVSVTHILHFHLFLCHMHFIPSALQVRQKRIQAVSSDLTASQVFFFFCKSLYIGSIISDGREKK